MGLELGRISGQMLKSDLVRLGVDLAFETDFLYLNVNDRRIGINTDSPARTLEINNSVLTTDLIVDTQNKVGNLVFENNTISSTLGNIYINALGPNSSFNFPSLQTDQLKFGNNVISTFNSNAGIELRPHGLGTTVIGTALASTELNITGNLHSTGDITFNGNITFGSDNADSVSFNSDIASDIIPNSTGLTLGNTDYRWSTLETILVNGDALNANSIVAGNSGIDLVLRQGNIYYVSKNGNDLNSGTHENDPYLTLAKALSEASNGDTVYIYPGTYEEQLPLTVPAGVSIRGTSIRSVTVKPAATYESKDVFLVNGETTIEDLTVSGFRYDSILDVGYAFRFAPGFTVTSRSPYIKNVSVITRGSVTTVSDPLGFDQGDAGRGALIDGSVANSSSKEASLLFHAATFITPNADCITMTNGVRVEWLNSFIYYANRGLYATNGAQGFASLGLKFGAEIRSIGSANVYGNFGCVADGADTLMYLISHNFGYIGAGKDDSNDTTLVIQANEVVELNSGQVRYATQDQRGDFRIGDSFFVDFKTGSTSISVEDLGITGLSSLKFISGGDVTFITAEKIDTGNFNIQLDTIKTISGDVNISPITGIINFNNSVDVVGDMSIQGDVTVGGQITVGNQTFDTATIAGKISSGINPDVTGTYDLGSPIKNWANIFISNLNLDDIRVSGNVIRTTQSNSNLELTANGTGNISVPESDALFNQALTVNQTSNLKSVDVQGIISATGDINLTGNIAQTGNRSITGNISVDNQSTFGNVRFNTNFISAINNNDLVLKTSGTGKISIQTNLVVNNNVTVTGNINVPNVTVISDAGGDTLTNNIIKIQDNFITREESPVLPSIIVNPSPGGTGERDDFSFNIVSNDKFLIISSSGQDNPPSVDSGVVYIYDANTGSLLRTLVNPNASGTAAGDFFGQSVDISGDLLAVGTPAESSDSGVIYIFNAETGSLLRTITNPNIFGTTVGDRFGEKVAADGNFLVVSTPAESTVSTSASGVVYVFDITTGNLLHSIPNPAPVNFGYFGQSIDISGNYVIIGSLQNAAWIYNATTGQLVHTLTAPPLSSSFGAEVSISGNYAIVGAPTPSGVGGQAYVYNVTTGSLVRTITNPEPIGTQSNDRFGRKVKIFENYALISAPFQGINDDTGKVFLYEITSGNLIRTFTSPDPTKPYFGESINLNLTHAFIGFPVVFVESGSNTSQVHIYKLFDGLELRAAGTGKILIPSNDVVFENNLTVSSSTEFKNTNISGNLTFTGSKTLTGDITQTGDASISNGLTVGDIGTFGNVIFNTDWISTAAGDLDLRASGSGKVIIPSNNVTANNIYAGDTTFASVTIQQGVSASTITNSDLTLTTNYITTDNLNTDLIIEASGTGKIYSPTNSWQVDNNLVIGQASALTNLTVTGSLGITGNINFVGEKTQTGGGSVSNGLVVGDIGTFGNVIFNTDWISTTVGDLDLRASGTGKIIIPSNDVIAENIYAGDTTFASVTIQQGVSASIITNGDLTITTNYITTNNLNTDLVLEANNLGKLYSPTNSWQVDNNLVVGQSAALKNLTVTGPLAVTGNINHIGNKTQTGTIDISSTVTVTDTAQLGNVIFKTNFVSTSAGDLDLRASGTGKVLIPTNNVIVEQDIYAPTTNFANITVSQTVSAANLTDNTILINGNVITTINGNDNLVLDPAGVGEVIFGSPALFDNNFTVNQQTNLKNLAVLGSVTHTGNYQQTGTVNRFGQIQLFGKFVNTSLAQFEDIQINNNFITTTSTNANLELRANGTGKVLVPNNTVEIQNNLTVGGLPTFSALTLSNRLTADEFVNPDILIKDNFITTTNGNKNLDLRGVGTGGVFLEELRFTPQNEIRTMSNNRDIVFTPDATKNFIIDKTSALKLPTGTTADRSILATSDFRFNTSVNLFEGLNSSAKRTFGGLYSENRQTYVKTEPVASLGTIRFNASGIETMRAGNNGLSMNGLIVDSLTEINGNTISTVSGNSDISLIPNGTGKVQLAQRLTVIDSEFTNTAPSAIPILFSSTGNGFYKFEGSAGVVIPVGTTAQRSFVDLGDTRWNTELETIEIYDGVQYISAGGAGGVTEAFMEDLSNIYAIILG